MKEMNPMYCPGKEANTRSWTNFSRARQMTVFHSKFTAGVKRRRFICGVLS